MIPELLLKDPVTTHALNELGKGNIQPFCNGFLNITNGKMANKFGNGWQIENNIIRPFGNGSIDSNGKRLSQFGSGLSSSNGSIINRFGNGLSSTNSGYLSPFGNGINLDKKLF